MASLSTAQFVVDSLVVAQMIEESTRSVLTLAIAQALETAPTQKLLASTAAAVEQSGLAKMIQLRRLAEREPTGANISAAQRSELALMEWASEQCDFPYDDQANGETQ